MYLRCKPNKYPRPAKVQNLRQFLVSVNFYRRFIQGATKIQHPLIIQLCGSKKKNNTPIEWTRELKHAFVELKNALADAAMLAHPIVGAKLSINVDSSDYAIGAVLQQSVNESWQSLAFFTKSLSAPQRKYSAFDRELLTAYAAVKRFRYFVEGRDFIIYTDHKLLTFAFQQDLNKFSPRQFRYLNYISQFTTDVRHVSDVNNVVADALSRIESVESIDYKKLA